MNNVVIGIDIGGTNTVFGIINKKGDVISSNSIPTNDFPDVKEYVINLCSELKKIITSVGETYTLKAIGIGAPNGNYYTGTIEYAPNLKWKGIVHLTDMIKKEMNVPTFLTNDANAAAIGEMIFGGAKFMNDFIVITLGTGLGSGIVANGKVIYGSDGFAGEIGHTIVDVNGRTCGCGRKGCLETYASATGIKTTVLELISTTDLKSELRNISPDKITSIGIAEAASTGDKLALEAFDYTAKILGLKLADAVAFTSPKAIFLFGGLANSGDLIIKPTKKYMEEYMLEIFKNKVEILPSEISNANAAILGASALAWNELKYI